MCGIAGIVSLSPDALVEPAHLGLMAGQLVHRGPDDYGRYVDPHRRCGFGFRRLSIIDVSGGHQPIRNEDGTVWVVFNGEIYNFRELRGELELRGHKFATDSDSEVVVHAYEEFGEGCFERLHGMFAIGVWDERRGRLTLARDRFGKKPLVYAIIDDRLLFASEAKAILATPGAPRELDVQSLHRYLLFQYVPAPHSIFRGFRKLSPGHVLSVDAQRPLEARPRAFWRLPNPSPFVGNYADAKAWLAQLLRSAVKKRLVSDVPLGAFLSGGIDSSIVVSLMHELGVSPLRTFSIGFADPRYDETAYARQVAAHFGTEHHEYVVRPDAIGILERLAYHFDEPFADSSSIPTWYVSYWTRQSVTVALTGDAGDECFAGYDRYRAVAMAARFDLAPRPLRRLIARAARFVPPGRAKSLTNRVHRFLRPLGLPAPQRYLSWINVFSPQMLTEGYRPEFAEQIDFAEPLYWFESLHAAAPGPAANKAIVTDMQSYLPYDLLTKVDVASMACGLECRCPFLDHELVAFALSLPLAWRLGRDGGKRILRDWARDRLPVEVLRRRKMGFGVPVGEWFRQELREWLRERLLGENSLSSRIFRPDWLRGLVDSHQAGRASHEHALWSLVMLEEWNRRWQPTV